MYVSSTSICMMNIAIKVGNNNQSLLVKCTVEVNFFSIYTCSHLIL